ncbi:DUF5959 family protein [Streptomyces sp. NBC_01294]|uniref:DUF5959 family protein n=1 Tax=Streptomyces sp. NBC_01294 TaxID=2903815 RepID=UPI002DD93EA4|nr:DUF5959 family protein [Streptomyces sp. NBC_01294]WRZ58484.1 DUF5959 family protein [Streptomyces sp. NBC_01294]
MDLIDLGDADGNRCVVRVTGRYQPGVLTGHDTLQADVLVSASFADARLELYILPQDLDTWQHDLTRLAPGKGATIGGDRGLSLGFFMHEDRTLSLMVQDPDRMSLAMGIAPQETWIQDHRQRLEQVRETWPSEVVETGPMTFEWNPNRRG